MSIKDENVVDLFTYEEAKEARDILDADEYFDAEMTFYDYQASATLTLGPDRNPLMMALGVGGEAGEVLEIIKKGNRPGREVDVVHLKEEIGDVLWYLAVLADYYDLDLEEIAVENLEKLEKRYGAKA